MANKITIYEKIIIFSIPMLIGMLIFATIGAKKAERDKNEDIQYVIETHGETTQTLIKGLNIILNDEKPKANYIILY